MRLKLCIFSALFLSALSAGGCITQDDTEHAWLDEPYTTEDYALDSDAGCGGYECTITGQATRGELIKVSCKGTHSVMLFCYSIQGQCGASAPSTGDSVCLSDKPSDERTTETECLNDPCCVSCEWPVNNQDPTEIEPQQSK